MKALFSTLLIYLMLPFCVHAQLVDYFPKADTLATFTFTVPTYVWSSNTNNGLDSISLEVGYADEDGFFEDQESGTRSKNFYFLYRDSLDVVSYELLYNVREGEYKQASENETFEIGGHETIFLFRMTRNEQPVDSLLLFIDQNFGLSTEDEQSPSSFELHQNYPNPFNPSTNIAFTLKTGSRVTITIYDITGRLIETVTNRNFARGFHSITFDGTGLASGLYFYRLKSNNFTQTRRMILMK